MKKLVTALLLATAAWNLPEAHAAGPEPAPTIHGSVSDAEERTIRGLLVEFGAWIEENTDLEVDAGRIAAIRFVEPGDLVIADGEEHWVRQHNRGLYDPASTQIYLTRPWNHADPYDRSILLHELVHDAQVESRHWYCPQAMEWDAYKLQEQWLAAHDVDSGFNWTSILLESSCARRDHHPD